MKALISLTSIAVITLLAEIFGFKKKFLPIVLIGIVVTSVLAVMDWNTAIAYYNNMMVFDNYAISFLLVLLLVSFFWFLTSRDYFKDEPNVSDHYALILFAIFGGFLMVSYNNMTMLFLGIETLSISLYVLAGSRKSDVSSNEAAMKYFLMGSFATGFLLFGIALIYGTSGSFDLMKIAEFVKASQGNVSAIFITGLLMMLVGLSFKVAMAPFHFWTPDVYQGSPTPVTAFMATVVKTAAFAAFFRLFHTCFSGVQNHWSEVIWVMAALTLLIGNITAIAQTAVKRMLAYSSIAHAGYMMLAVLALNQYSKGAILYYSVAYSFSTLLAFGVLHHVHKTSKTDHIDGFRGLLKTNPVMAICMSIALLSLAGIPPTAGFFAKYYIFSAAISQGFIGLVVIAVIASLISVFFYFRVMLAMLVQEPSGKEEANNSPFNRFFLVFAAFLIILLGLFPDLIIKLI